MYQIVGTMEYVKCHRQTIDFNIFYCRFFLTNKYNSKKNRNNNKTIISSFSDINNYLYQKNLIL